MNTKANDVSESEKRVTVEDVNRLLEVGRLLFSVLTSEEIEALQEKLSKHSSSEELGNAGDS